jgi:aspartate racemase
VRLEGRPGAHALPVSYAQRRLWFLARLDPHSTAYSVPCTLRLVGALDVAALQHALDALVARHEILRTTFAESDGEPVQIILPASGVAIARSDLSGVAADRRTAEARRVASADQHAAFDLEREPPLRVRLIRLGPDEHVLVLVMHHIICDGWSFAVLLRELGELYSASAEGRAPRLPELPVQYADFAAWQRELLAGGGMERGLAYWREKLADAPGAIGLPTDRARPARPSFRGDAVSIELGADLLRDLRRVSHTRHATLFMTLLAGFKLLLARYTGQTDLVVGSPIANRTRTELEGLIGFFVNTLPLRTDLSGDPPFLDVLSRVRETALGAFAHQDMPFDRLVEELRPERVVSRSPLFNVMFALQNAPSSGLQLAGVTVETMELGHTTAKLDLTLFAFEGASGGGAAFEYSADLFDRDTVQRMLERYRACLEAVAADPTRRLSQIPLTTADEVRRLIVMGRGAASGYPAERGIPELFEAQVARAPDAPAVLAGGETVTYGELNQRANRLARALRRRGVGAESCVGIALAPSAALVVATLAALKAGGAYVPLDLANPPERLRSMLEDARVRVVVTDAAHRGRLPPTSASILSIAEEAAGSQEDPRNLGAAPGGDRLACVMYTSGSTGRPKGVAVPHRAVVRLVANTDYAQLGADDCVAQVSSTSFDAFSFELWGALLNGARLVILGRDIVLSPRALARALDEYRVTALFVTTALFNQLAADRPTMTASVRHLLFGGERADTQRVRQVLSHGGPARLVHVYGPTECTTFATWQHVTQVPPDATSVPIGRAIANTHVFVLDEHMRPVPVDVPGELYVGGPGLARGYVGGPGATAGRFVPDPFSGEPGARLYRTGDRVRWRSDEALEFLGRPDGQVKLRGFRIEVQEIEHALARHPAVRHCAVLLREDRPGEKALVAYVVTHAASDGASGALGPELRAHLRSQLPAYMVPAAIVQLEALPLNRNGKLDRKALPPPGGAEQYARPVVPPSTPLQQRLAAIWSDVLGVEPIGADDDFFELGGHSLLAIKLFARLEQELGRRLPVATLFESPTIRGLAAAVEQADSPGATGTATHVLVTLQARGSLPPLFCVHDVDGMILCYGPLARLLGRERPIHGLQAPRDRHGRPPLRTMERMAAEYIREMRSVQPSGPYHLIGYCWSGCLAFEMARQLQAGGEEVAFLGLIDSVCPLRAATTLAQRVRRQSRRLARTSWPDLPSFLRTRASNIWDRWAVALAFRWSVRCRRALLPALRSMRVVHEKALQQYRPRPYAGAVTLFRSRGTPISGTSSGLAADPLGWDAVARGAVEVHEVAGEHLTILQPPYVGALASQLRECLRRVAGVAGACDQPAAARTCDPGGAAHSCAARRAPPRGSTLRPIGAMRAPSV